MRIFNDYSIGSYCDTVFFDVSFHYKAVMQSNLSSSLVCHQGGNPDEVAVVDGMVLVAEGSCCHGKVLEEEAGNCCHDKASEKVVLEDGNRVY